MEPVSGQQDASIKKPVVLGVRAEHTLYLADQGGVSRAGALDVAGALGRRAIQRRLEHVPQSPELVRTDGAEGSSFIHFGPPASALL